MKPEHGLVAVGFSEYGSCRDGGVFAISFYHTLVGCGRVGMEFVAIHQDELGAGAERVEGAVHGKKRRLKDVDSVNFFGANFGYRPRKAFFFNDFAQFIALVFCKLFGVVQQGVVKIFWQNNRRCEHRACQTAPTCFVAASLQKFGLMKREECHAAKVGK